MVFIASLDLALHNLEINSMPLRIICNQGRDDIRLYLQKAYSPTYQENIALYKK